METTHKSRQRAPTSVKSLASPSFPSGQQRAHRVAESIKDTGYFKDSPNNLNPKTVSTVLQQYNSADGMNYRLNELKDDGLAGSLIFKWP